MPCAYAGTRMISAAGRTAGGLRRARRDSLTPGLFFGPMRFDVVTLFPQASRVPSRTSILGRAAGSGASEFAIRH